MTKASELEARAAALVPKLRERADAVDRQARLPDETIRDLIDAELVKAMVPARHGGFELDWRDGGTILETLAQGCGSTAWVMNAYLSTTWVIATFPEQAQQEIFGDKGYALGPCPMNPMMGRARRVDGGWRVTLRAPFGSGVLHSECAIVCAMVEGDDAGTGDVPMALVMILPRQDYSFSLDSWAVLGMRGTASATLEVDDVFVPDHRAVDLARLVMGTMPGTEVNTAPMYRVPFLAGFSLMGVRAVLGLARCGLTELVEMLKTQTYALTGKPKLESVANQMRVGEVAAYVNAAAGLVDADLRRLAAGVADGTLSIEDRAMFRVNLAYAGKLCRNAIDAVKETAGANAMRDGSTVQRVYRDIHMVCGNFGFQLDYMKELYGRARLGLPIDVTEV